MLNICISCNLVFALLSIYAPEIYTYVHQKTSKEVIAAIIAKTWKQPMCLSTIEWINKLSYVYTNVYSMVIVSVNELLPNATT